MIRSYLFVPADSAAKIPKALASEADAVILDLEDSVALADKPQARRLAAETLSGARGKPLYVRTNAWDSGLIEADLAAVLAARPDGLVLPKSGSGADVKRLGERAGLPSHRVQALVLAFSEVATNAMLHGGGMTNAALWIDGDGVV